MDKKAHTNILNIKTLNGGTYIIIASIRSYFIYADTST